MLLLYPPVFRPAEPPAGIARLAGFLRDRGISCRTIDLNYLFMAGMLRDSDTAGQDKFSKRALKNRERNLSMLRSPGGYGNTDRYTRAVHEINRVLESTAAGQASISLSDYAEPGKSPVRSADLIAAFESPNQSPLYSWFAPVLDALLTDEPAAALHNQAEGAAGFSLCFLSQALPAFAMAGYIRKTAPRIRLVFGGGLVTSWMRLPDWNNPFSGIIDRLIAGPGEEQLLEFLAGSVNSSSADAPAGKAVFAMPDYKDLSGNRYLAPGFILPFAASSGCSWRHCRFCPEHAEKPPCRTPAPGAVIGQLSALIRETGPVLIHFLDSEMSPVLLRALADAPPGPAWYGFTRFHRDLADPEYCRRLKTAGCIMLKLGLESGSRAVLEKSGKGIELSMASAVLRALKAAGIGVYLYLLFGTPWEGYGEAMETLEFTAAHADTVGFLNLAVFNLPRGSELAGELAARPFGEGDLSLYSDFGHPSGWNRTEVRNFLDREFRRHPAIAPIVRRQPPFFGSSHGPFLLSPSGMPGIFPINKT